MNFFTKLSFTILIRIYYRDSIRQLYLVGMRVQGNYKMFLDTLEIQDSSYSVLETYSHSYLTGKIVMTTLLNFHLSIILM